MALDTHRNANGFCEMCEAKLPLGTAPAHIIPRNIHDATLDEEWNTALLGYVSYYNCICHTKLDENRGKAYQDMLTEKHEPRLLTRIKDNTRLREYFEKKLAVWEVKQEQAERNKDE